MTNTTRLKRHLCDQHYRDRKVRFWVVRSLRDQWRSYYRRADDLFLDPSNAWTSFRNIYNDMAGA